jgi:hypothetical protein
MEQEFNDAELSKERDFCCLSFSLLSRLVFWSCWSFSVQALSRFRTLLVESLKTVAAESKDLVDGTEALSMRSVRTRQGAHLDQGFHRSSFMLSIFFRRLKNMKVENFSPGCTDGAEAHRHGVADNFLLSAFAFAFDFTYAPLHLSGTPAIRPLVLIC